MPAKQRTYLCIDMKSFYASVECAERDLDPFETDLAVADVSRGANALCLAITPKMKSRGIKNRCRLSEIPGDVEYIIAPPRMQLYIDYAADIYAIYLDYFAPEDIHVYSIDECFIDATGYLKTYKLTPKEMARKLMREISSRLKIPSTAGIGTNLYLAKIALDITAKHSDDRIGYLDETLYKEQLWEHEPITDFWMIAGGTARRLARYGISNMRGIAQAPEKLMYKTFGINAELLIDHAWGREPCRMEDIKNYRAKSHSVSFSQILPRDYAFDEARIVMEEMLFHGCKELLKRRVVTKKIWLGVGYSKDALPFSKGSTRIFSASNVPSVLLRPTMELFDGIADRNTLIRRLGICFSDVTDEDAQSCDLFTDWTAVEKERARERAVMELTSRYGKNAVLRGINFMDGATQRERNEMIGGHRAGYDDTKRPR